MSTNRQKRSIRQPWDRPTTQQARKLAAIKREHPGWRLPSPMTYGLAADLIAASPLFAAERAKAEREVGARGLRIAIGNASGPGRVGSAGAETRWRWTVRSRGRRRYRAHWTLRGLTARPWT
jgi:hypothetical protein